MMSTFLVIMFFSSGMPVMYIFAFAFFLFTYVVNKILILQYYKKDREFTSEIPYVCATIFKYAIFLKLFVGFFMFLNTNVLRLKENSHEGLLVHEILYIVLVSVYFYVFFGGAKTV